MNPYPTTTVQRLIEAGFPLGPTPEDNCQVCDHLWGNHLLVASSSGDPLDGGHAVCPFHECGCTVLWGLTAAQRDAARASRERRS